MHKKKKILFICPYPVDEAPSQRFRFEQYFKTLQAAGYEYNVASFLNKKSWGKLYLPDKLLAKASAVLLGFTKRKLLLFKLKQYDYIFIHREATPIGPPFFEWTVRYLWRKPIIYDFDDAIWLEDASEKSTIKSALKWKSKVAGICRWSEQVSCGNQYLADYALQFNKQVVLNPTTIDTSELHVPQDNPRADLLTIGWTGTHSTLIYLELILDSLLKLNEEIPFKMRIIANRAPSFNFPAMEFIFWDKKSEIADLNHIDIGIMPLTDDQWSKGKCGFKALQYMALEKPVVGSAVGVNSEIIPNGGLLAKDQEEWISALRKLLIDHQLRTRLGKQGRAFIKNHYSVQSNADNFLSLFSKKK